MNWSGYEWNIGQKWGIIHPEVTRQWYSDKAVIVDEYDNLHLLTHRDPKKFIIDDEEITSPFGIGLITSKENFQYGYFEIEAKLPVGENLFPAFWIGGAYDWPPEIDIFEASTKKTQKYFDFNFTHKLYDVRYNIHYGDYPATKAETGSKRGFLKKDPTRHFIKYALSWKEDKIEIFYDGKQVYENKDRKILDQLNNEKDMTVILNNAVKKEHDGIGYSDFVIRNFKYEKY